MTKNTLLVLSLLQMGVLAETARTPVNLNRDCGAYCVDLALRLTHQAEIPPFDELKARAQITESGTTNLLAIANALEGLGLSVQGVDDDEREPQGMCIAQLVRTESGAPASHFVVIEPLEPGSVLVYSPPVWVRKTSWSELRDRIGKPILMFERPRAVDPQYWGVLGIGVSVLVALTIVIFLRTRSVARSSRVAVTAICLGFASLLGCGSDEVDQSPLLVEPGSIDLGAIEAGSYPIKFTVRNTTDEPLRCSSISTTCGCVEIEFENEDPLGAGESRTGLATVAAYPGERQVVDLTFEAGTDLPASMRIMFKGTAKTRPGSERQLSNVRIGEPSRFRLVHKFEPIEGLPVPLAQVSEWLVAYRNKFSVRANGMERQNGCVTCWADCVLVPDFHGPGEEHVVLFFGKRFHAFKVIWDATSKSGCDRKLVILERSASGALVATVRLAWPGARGSDLPEIDAHPALRCEARRLDESVLELELWADQLLPRLYSIQIGALGDRAPRTILSVTPSILGADRGGE